MKNKLNQMSKADFSVKSMSILVALFFLTTAVPLVAATQGTTENTVTIERQFQFNAPTLVDNGDEVGIVVEGIDGTTTQPGAPQLPKFVYREDLPFGATDVQVELTDYTTHSIKIDNIVTPSPIPHVLPFNRENYPLARLIIGIYNRIAPNAEFNTYESAYEGMQKFDNSIYGQHVAYGQRFESNVLVGRATNDLGTYVVIWIQPVVLTDVAEGNGEYLTSADVRITYTEPSTLGTLPVVEEYDLLIIAPKGYKRALAPLVAHKESLGFKPKLVITDEIYAGEYFTPSTIYNRDNAEKVKYFLYQALLEWNISMVMAVGSWRTALGLNIPAFTFPVRFSHNSDAPGGGEPGYVSEQYFSTLMRYDQVDGWVFDDWDTNNNNIFGENGEGPYDEYDMFPEISFGRLACTNIKEVKTLVDKIIFYETHYYIDEPWFNTMLTVTGDGFQDLGMDTDLTFDWDVNSIPNGDYTICAVSNVGTLYGPVDKITVTVDHNAPSAPTKILDKGTAEERTVLNWFLEDDHLYIEPLDPEQPEVYPGKPVAEICVPGTQNVVLGNTYYPDYNPDEAYCSDNWNWGLVSYQGGVLKIKTKSYDPTEKGQAPSDSYITLWIEAANGTKVLDNVTKFSRMYYEGEVEAQHAKDHFIPDVYNGNNFTTLKTWTSNGNFMRLLDVIEDISQGQGFVYFAGHSSCMAWGDHFPGIPGGRANGMVNGLATINLKYGYERYQAAEGDPLFPIDQLTNGYKLPVLFLSGCHSGQFDTSLASVLADPESVLFGARYATWTPEGMAWWMVRVPQGGSIATFGNTALGYGIFGWQGPNYLTGYMYGHCIGWYFNVTAQQELHTDMLGPLHRITLIDYYLEFMEFDMGDVVDRKTWEEFNLLGDPSLKIGGYPPSTGGAQSTDYDLVVAPIELDESGRIVSTSIENIGTYTGLLDYEIRFTGISPLGRYLYKQSGDLLYEVLRGHVFGENITRGSIALSPGETENISSNPVFGFGHILINVTVTYGDPVIVTWMEHEEDGFLLGNRLLLFYGEE